MKYLSQVLTADGEWLAVGDVMCSYTDALHQAYENAVSLHGYRAVELESYLEELSK